MLLFNKIKNNKINFIIQIYNLYKNYLNFISNIYIYKYILLIIYKTSVVPNDQKTPRTRTSFAFVLKYERLIFMIRHPKNPRTRTIVRFAFVRGTTLYKTHNLLRFKV